MYYVIFSKSNNETVLNYIGDIKETASNIFLAKIKAFLSVDSNAGKQCFVGFDEDLPFIKQVKALGSYEPSNNNSTEILNIILPNLHLATFSNINSASGYNHIPSITYDCGDCECKKTVVYKNVYNTLLCADCWTKYWETKESLAEYVVGLANGDYNIDDFTETDRGRIIDAWQDEYEVSPGGNTLKRQGNRARLIDAGWTEAALAEVETKSGLFTAATDLEVGSEEE
jgi:hypothetical protein